MRTRWQRPVAVVVEHLFSLLYADKNNFFFVMGAHDDEDKIIELIVRRSPYIQRAALCFALKFPRPPSVMVYDTTDMNVAQLLAYFRQHPKFVWIPPHAINGWLLFNAHIRFRLKRWRDRALRRDMTGCSMHDFETSSSLPLVDPDTIPVNL